jgi:hypothetical protein
MRGGFAELCVAEFFLHLATLVFAFGGPRDIRPPVAILAPIAERMTKPMKRPLLCFSSVLACELKPIDFFEDRRNINPPTSVQERCECWIA